MISHIHHINFLVRDLDIAVKGYSEMLGIGDFIFDSLEGRAVKTARVKLGDCWLVLVQPLEKTSIPAKHLAQHGEGFFLISLGTNHLDQHLEQIEKLGCDMSASQKRAGLDNWTVADVPAKDFFGAQFQLTEETPKHK